MDIIALIVPSILGLIAIYYAAKHYTAIESPFFNGVGPLKVDRFHNQHIDAGGSYATYNSIVFDVQGSAPDQLFFRILRDVTCNGIPIRKVEDVKRAFQQPEARENTVVEAKGYIIKRMSVADAWIRQSDYLVVRVFDLAKKHYQIEVKLVFKDKKPIWVSLENEGGGQVFGMYRGEQQSTSTGYNKVNLNKNSEQGSI